MTRTPQSTIDNLRRLESEATPGDWCVKESTPDREFIAAMRNSIVQLLAEHDALATIAEAALSVVDTHDEIDADVGPDFDAVIDPLRALTRQYFAPSKDPIK